MQLTEGAIALLSEREAPQNPDWKPVLQVMDVRLVNSQNNQNAKERYRLLLSDGVHTQQGMLATQLNGLVNAKRLQNGSIIRLILFVSNLIQTRTIIIITDLEVILETYKQIGEPKPYVLRTNNDVSTQRPSASVSVVNHPVSFTGFPQSAGAGSITGGSAPRPNVAGATHLQPPEMGSGVGSPAYGSSVGSNTDSGWYNSTTAPPVYSRTEPGSGASRASANTYLRPSQPSNQHPQPVFTNRGPISRNEAAPRIIPIAALNPYQGRWTIKARVTAKSGLRQYHTNRGEGKVFNFDLLDSDGGEIRVTCFNTVADQFFDQIELGKVYMISKGTLKPAQKAFNHLPNEYEITLENTSTIQPCIEDDRSIPQQQFHFRTIDEIEGMDNDSVVDVIGVVTSISPSSTIMTKKGTETQKRSLQLKDMSCRSVELTLWGNICNAEGQILQNICDSGVFPVLAVKSGKVNEFNGKAVGTLASSQLFINPDFPEARKLKEWFDRDGKNVASVSISRETTAIGRADVRKTISQIKDENLGTSEKPDWITVCATLTFIKLDNFCYPACPIRIGDRQCNKKVTNNGDGKWRCDRCDQIVDECDYRYVLQLQIQDHTGLTWVTAFQEFGEEIIGESAKDLYYMKHEEHDDDRFNEIMRNIVFKKYVFKLKVKEETFSDEQRVRSTVVKAERINFESETRYVLDLINKMKNDDLGSLPLKTENVIPSSGQSITGVGGGIRDPAPPTSNYNASTVGVGRESRVNANYQGTSSGSQYGGSRFPPTGHTGMYSNCTSCGATGHSSVNCPSVMSNPGQRYGGSFGNRVSSGANAGGNECFKCHQSGHWARDCPGVINAPPAYGGGSAAPSRYGNAARQHVGGY